MRLKKEEVFMEMNDVILNKTVTIERCIKRIQEVYEGNPKNLTDYTKQDSIILFILHSHHYLLSILIWCPIIPLKQ